MHKIYKLLSDITNKIHTFFSLKEYDTRKKKDYTEQVKKHPYFLLKKGDIIKEIDDNLERYILLNEDVQFHNNRFLSASCIKIRVSSKYLSIDNASSISYFPEYEEVIPIIQKISRDEFIAQYNTVVTSILKSIDK